VWGWAQQSCCFPSEQVCKLLLSWQALVTAVGQVLLRQEGASPAARSSCAIGEACCAAWHSFWQGHVMLLLPILVVCVIPKNSLVACPRHTGLCCHAPNAGWVGGIRHLHARLHGGAADVIASTLLLSCNT
jgi:hypothetical protein